MRTRSSSNLVGESSPDPTSSNPKRHNRRRSEQPFILEESPVDTMADQRTMVELLCTPTEGYAEAIVVPPILAKHFELKHSMDRYKDLLRACPHHSFTELHQLDTFYNALNPTDQDSLISVVGSNLLERRTQDVLMIIENKSEEDERIKETLTDQDLAEYTIKVPPPLVQKAKPHSQRNYVVHQRDPLHPNIPYPSRMHKQKRQEKDEIQIRKFWQVFKELHMNITLADALILIPKYQKMLKALLSNKEKLLELANTPLNENCSVVILKKLPKKLRDPGKFLILCGFSELKCKALANLGASINLIPLLLWKNLGLPELVSTRMTLELANQAICTPAGIARDVFVLVGKFTFLADFVIVDYESDPRVPLILGRPFLRTARALIDVHGEEMILRDANHQSGNPTSSSHPDLNSPEVINPLSGSTTSSSPDHLLEEFAMFTDEHTLDYSSLTLYDDFDDDLFEFESDNDDAYNDPFDSNEDKIKESKLLIDELDLPRSSDFLPSPEHDSFLFEDFFEVDALPSTNNEDQVFNLGILIHENLSDVTVQVAPDKNLKKISISHAFLILEDFNPPLYELPFHK
nr:reverse transcriptase domain-containing protein [Tanacetum cinerariifolium]